MKESIENKRPGGGISGSGLPPIPSKNPTKNATRNILVVSGIILLAVLALIILL